jgi:hypothetical protein
MSKATQNQRVIDYINRFGSITQLEALRDLGVMRLASRVSDLRTSGFEIKKEMITVKNRFDEECRVARYSMR